MIISLRDTLTTCSPPSLSYSWISLINLFTLQLNLLFSGCTHHLSLPLRSGIYFCTRLLYYLGESAPVRLYTYINPVQESSPRYLWAPLSVHQRAPIKFLRVQHFHWGCRVLWYMETRLTRTDKRLTATSQTYVMTDTVQFYLSCAASTSQEGTEVYCLQLPVCWNTNNEGEFQHTWYRVNMFFCIFVWGYMHIKNLLPLDLYAQHKLCYKNCTLSNKLYYKNCTLSIVSETDKH